MGGAWLPKLDKSIVVSAKNVSISVIADSELFQTFAIKLYLERGRASKDITTDGFVRMLTLDVSEYIFDPEKIANPDLKQILNLTREKIDEFAERHKETKTWAIGVLVKLTLFNLVEKKELTLETENS